MSSKNETVRVTNESLVARIPIIGPRFIISILSILVLAKTACTRHKLIFFHH